MIEDLINSIVLAETEAERLIKESEVLSKQLLSDTKSEISAMEKSAIQQCKVIISKNLAEAEVIAEKKCDELLKENLINVEKLAKGAEKNIKKATELVLEELLKKYANS